MALAGGASVLLGRGGELNVSRFSGILVGVALVLAWLALIFVFPPSRQDFPLGDDFAFSQSAIRLARGEGIHYGEHASMPLLGQWLWAMPFLWLGSGWPHSALRLSTAVLSGFGLLA